MSLRTAPRFAWWLVLPALCLPACGGDGGGEVDLRLETEWLVLEVDPQAGYSSLRTAGGEVGLRGLHLAVEVEQGGHLRLYTTAGKPMSCSRERTGDADTIRCDADTQRGVSAALQWTLRDGRPRSVEYRTTFRNNSDAPVAIRRVFPFRLAADDGGALLIGDDPAGVRMLQNGTDEVIDFYVDMLPGDTPLTDPGENPLFTERSSYSNGSLLIHDLQGGASLLAGFLEFAWATPLVAAAGDASGLTSLHAEARYPRSVEIAPGVQVPGGTAVFLPAEGSPFDALEGYADRLADWHGIELPPRPQSGWDSWYTSFAHSDIDEAFVLGNADALAAHFGDFGLDSMQVDLGWQDTWGDWNGHAGFPAGMQAMAEAIQERGIRPELWMAPLSAEEASRVWQEHADLWFLPKNLWGGILMAPDMHPFDLRLPEVMDHVRSLGERVRGWKYPSVKMDFAYYILYSDPPADPEATPVALYREAVRAFREGAGAETYFINIAMCFLNYGLVDAFRLGLDDWPCWEGGADCAGYVTTGGKGSQGIKPVVRMAARRYWMNGRIWWNHHDQLYFRELTGDESRALASLAGLSGGMISLGEDARTLTAGQVDVYRRILPLTGATARPRDLFAREFPEVWHLELVAEPGAHILGLFHWGSNRDLTTHPYSDRVDGDDLAHQVDLAALGIGPGSWVAHEFWSGEVSVVEGSLAADLPPHSAKVFKLVPRSEEPVFVATNRHLLMGTGFVDAVAWEPSTGILSGGVRTTPGFAQTLTFFLPAGLGVASVELAGVGGLSHELQGQVLTVAFDGLDARRHSFAIALE